MVSSKIVANKAKILKHKTNVVSYVQKIGQLTRNIAEHIRTIQTINYNINNVKSAI
jgi:hypothetical protein